MKKSGKIYAVCSISAVCAALSGLFAMAAEKGGVEVKMNDASRTGYTASFSYYDDAATNVQIVGGFQYHVAEDYHVLGKGVLLSKGDSWTNYLVNPEDWSKEQNLRHCGDDGYVKDMTKDEQTGAWTIDVDLTGGAYVYQYNVSYDNGETYERVIDPENIPECNAHGAHQTRSQFFVPYDAGKQPEEDDWTWLFPIEDESAAGEILYETYPGLGDEERPVEIYLPAGYDADRAEPYKVLYMLHGGGGEESDWFYQGNAGNIVDRLVAEKKCEEFLMVCMNSSAFDTGEAWVPHYSWDVDAISDDITEYLIPYVEENYNVSKEITDRGILGLSNGAKAANYMLYKVPDKFGYFAILSGSAAWMWPDETYDFSAMKQVKIYLGTSMADQNFLDTTYHTNTDKTITGLRELLEKQEIFCNGGGNPVVVDGSHDWFSWPVLLKDYVETALWK